MTNTRELFGSRIGFILISAGCAIGLGNIWRFPIMVGAYGGGAFVLLYLLSLLLLALPIMVMEFAVGRAARTNIGASYTKLVPGSIWGIWGRLAVAGNYLLMSFYTVISGWMIAYGFFFLRGDFDGLRPENIGPRFAEFVAEPLQLVLYSGLVTALGFAVCGMGLQKGVERVTKPMMIGLFLMLLLLVFRALSLPGAERGLAFYLLPDFERLMAAGFWKSLWAAMNQAFFTLSIGIGSMAVFGSYFGKERRLTGEAVNIALLDTLAALLAGMLIFPACFSFGVDVNAGPGLVFVTLPNVFAGMPGGRFWGTLFFVFLSFAALSTVFAVFENIVSFSMDVLGASRKKACLLNFFVVFLCSLPCALGFNLLSGFEPMGKGTNVLDLADFIVSANFLPLGALVCLLFCCGGRGWGWDAFITEADTGAGMRFPRILRPYLRWVLPVILLGIFLQGWLDKPS